MTVSYEERLAIPEALLIVRDKGAGYGSRTLPGQRRSSGHVYNGRAIAQRRTALDLTQRELAKLAGINQAQLSRLELGQRSIAGILQLADIALALGVEPGVLISECVKRKA
jgi:hypothetical protein